MEVVCWNGIHELGIEGGLNYVDEAFKVLIHEKLLFLTPFERWMAGDQAPSLSFFFLITSEFHMKIKRRRITRNYWLTNRLLVLRSFSMFNSQCLPSAFIDTCLYFRFRLVEKGLR